MRIRCERCATIYELDEKRLPAHGALVKCTRCGHVFRAAPPAPGPAAPPPEDQHEEPPRAAAEERTALFGFTAPAGAEQTASLAAVHPPEAAPPRRREPPAAASATIPGRQVSAWVWVLLATLLAALVLATGWYVVQSRAATPTTRVPAGEAFLPT